MSTALEAASLIMIPTSYSDGLLASVKPNDGAGDFTFTRGSNISATRVNEQGYIEKGYDNLLLQSNSFLTTWSQFNANPPVGGYEGYDGTNDAWLISKTGANGRIQQLISKSGVNAFSVYAKRADSDYILLQLVGGVSPNAKFNLITGEEISSFGEISVFSESIGNGWFRFTIIGGNALSLVRIYPTEETNNDATSGSIYIQDAMLNQGLVAYPYVETTTAPVAGGILEDMPRLDYSNGSCPSLLLEPSRTNILVNSEYFAGGAYNSTLVTQNYGTSPEGITNSALIDKNGVRYGRLDYSLNYPSGTYTFSAFVKGNDVVKLRLDYGAGPSKEAYINCANGQTTNHPYYPMDSISSVDYGNGWYRFICTTAIPNGFTLSFARIYVMDVVDGEGNTNPATAEIYGAQLEQDATYPTSYIPTYGTSQTRLVDTIDYNTIEPLSNLEGTLFVDLKSELNTLFSFAFLLNNDGASYVRVDNVASNRLRVLVRLNSVFPFSQTIFDAFTEGQDFKLALRYSENKVDLFVDGQKKIDGTGTWLMPSLNTLTWTGRGTETKQLLVFPTALSDDECIELTTI